MTSWRRRCAKSRAAWTTFVQAIVDETIAEHEAETGGAGGRLHRGPLRGRAQTRRLHAAQPALWLSACDRKTAPPSESDKTRSKSPSDST